MSEQEEEEDASLASMLGLSEDQVIVNEDTGEFSLKTKVDGKVENVNFKDILASYQIQKNTTQKSQALAEERKEFTKVSQEKINLLKQQFEMNTALTNQLQTELMNEYQNVNWDDLRHTDPAEWSAKQQEMNVRYSNIQGLQAQLQGQQGVVQQQQTVEYNAKRNELLQAQQDKMLANNPTWSNTEIMNTEKAAIRSFLVDDFGFSNEDIATIVDSRAINIIQDAMKYRAGKKVATPKLKAVGKISKSKGRKTSQKATKIQKLTAAAKSARGTNKRRAETDAVAALLFGGK